MNVFLRHYDEAVAQKLCDAEFSELDDVIAELRKWGVYHAGGVYREFEAQFHLDDTSAFAEIIVMGEPE